MKMTKVVRTVADVLYPFCMLYGLYIVAHGHLTPGGGFQGGAVIATATALLIVAHRHGDIMARVKSSSMKGFESAGLLGFLLLAFSGLILGRPFFQNWLLERGGMFADAVAYGSNAGNVNTAGLMPAMNVAVGLEVLGALTVIILYMLSGVKEEAS
jgi:multicomponent Na+:H+ antiporter subunit B